MTDKGINSYVRKLARVRLSQSFFMRDFLYSDITVEREETNVPIRSELAVIAGRELCRTILEPLAQTFGGLTIVCGYLNPTHCRLNRRDPKVHCWGFLDDNETIVAGASIYLPWFMDQHSLATDGKYLAGWVIQNLPCDHVLLDCDDNSIILCWTPKPRLLTRTRHKGVTTEIETAVLKNPEQSIDFPSLVLPKDCPYDDWPPI